MGFDVLSSFHYLIFEVVMKSVLRVLLASIEALFFGTSVMDICSNNIDSQMGTQQLAILLFLFKTNLLSVLTCSSSLREGYHEH